MPRSKHFAALSTVLLLCACIVATAETLRFSLVSREGVEARLRKYAGDNKQREATLKQMFTDAGCDGQHISEQPVKGSKLPNVICVLPGSSDKVIIVGAHFDRVSEGDGVVDNWSGASLLPSLYESNRLGAIRPASLRMTSFLELAWFAPLLVNRSLPHKIDK